MILQTTHLPERAGGGARGPLLPATLHRELEDQEATAWLTEPMIATDTEIAMTWTWRLGGEATKVWLTFIAACCSVAYSAALIIAAALTNAPTTP